MPVTRTATRALRKSLRKQKANKVIRDTVKDVAKEARKVASGKEKVAKDFLVKTAKTLDKAAKENVIHKNKAARLKSRIAAKIKAATKE